MSTIIEINPLQNPAFAEIPDFQRVTIDISNMSSYNANDIGPAVQETLDTYLEDPNSPGARLGLPAEPCRWATPVESTITGAQQILFQGVMGKTAITVDCGGANDMLSIGHEVSRGLGARLSFRDFTLVAPSPETFSCNRIIRIDSAGGGLVDMRDISVFGVYGNHGLIYVEDGQCDIDRLLFAGAVSISSSEEGLLQLYQVYNPHVNVLKHYNSVRFRGVNYPGGSTYSLLNWQAPQINFSLEIPSGGLYVDGVWSESLCAYPLLLNNLGSSVPAGGRARHINLRNLKLTGTASNSVTPIFVKECDSLYVESSFVNNPGNVSTHAIELRDVTRAKLVQFNPDTHVVDQSNIFYANDQCGTVFLDECSWGSRAGFPAGIDSSAARTIIRKDGIIYELRTADGAVTNKTLGKIGSAAGKVAKLATTDSVKLAVGGFGCDGVDGDKVLFAPLDGQEIPLMKDTGNVAVGDNLTASTATAGYVAKEGTSGNPTCGKAWTGDSSGSAAEIKVRFGQGVA